MNLPDHELWEITGLLASDSMSDDQRLTVALSALSELNNEKTIEREEFTLAFQLIEILKNLEKKNDNRTTGKNVALVQ